MESLHLGISKHKSRLGVRFDTAIQALTVEERSALEQSWLSDGSEFSGTQRFYCALMSVSGSPSASPQAGFYSWVDAVFLCGSRG